MPLPLLLAQAPGPIVLAQDAAFSWPIVVFLLGIAAAVGESRWRVARLEKDVENGEREVAEMKSEAATTKRDVAVMASSLARIEKGQESIERMLREALGRNSA